MNAIIEMVDRLMGLCPPDMVRTDDETDAARECYSEEGLREMLDNPDLVHAIYKANEGVPMWTASVRNFLIARLWQETRS